MGCGAVRTVYPYFRAAVAAVSGSVVSAGIKVYADIQVNGMGIAVSDDFGQYVILAAAVICGAVVNRMSPFF